MRVWAQDSNGDIVLGPPSQMFLVDNNAAVEQAILTALLLFQGEWFLDTTAGVPWLSRVIGVGTSPLYDTVIKNAILGVQGVARITSYQSSLLNNVLTVSVSVQTIFSTSITLNNIALTPLGAAPNNGVVTLEGYATGGYGR